MIFQNPKWLWGIPAALILMSWILFNLQLRKKAFGKLIDPSLWSRIAPEWDTGLLSRKVLLWGFAMVFACVAMARPQWGMREETVQTTGIDIMTVIDVSRSMMVEDEAPTRLKKAKHLVKTIMDGIHGDRMGLIIFAGSAFVVSPLTTDLAYVDETLEIVDPKMVANQGTDLGIAIETAVKSLDRGGESGKSTRAVIMITDGEDQGEAALKAAQQLKESGIQFFAIGVGTEKGGPIPVRDESGRLVGYKRDPKGQSVVSTFQPDSLKKITEAAGGRFFRATAGEREAEDILKLLGALNPNGIQERKIITYTERYQIFLSIALGLLILEMSLFGYRRRIRMGISAILVACLFSTLAQAASTGAYLDSEKGIKAFEAGEYEQAKKLFHQAKEKDPENPLTDFNEGSALSKQGDSEGAIESFGKSAEKAKQLKNESLAGRSWFNQGNTWVKKGDRSSAIQSYLNAIESARAANDPELEKMARKNIEILAQQQNQKKENKEEKKDDKKDDKKQDQKNPQDQKKDKNDPSEEDQKSKQNQKDQKDDQQGKKEDEQKQGQNQTPQKKEFKSGTLNKEDAERVMQELSSQQKELQTRLKKQKGQPMNREKDW